MSYRDDVRRHSDYDRREDYDRRDRRRGGSRVDDAFGEVFDILNDHGKDLENLIKDVRHLNTFLTSHENTFKDMYDGKYDGGQGGVLNHVPGSSRDAPQQSRGTDEMDERGRKRSYNLKAGALGDDSLMYTNNNHNTNQYVEEAAQQVSAQQQNNYGESSMQTGYVLNLIKENPFKNNKDWTKLGKQSNERYLTLPDTPIIIANFIDATSIDVIEGLGKEGETYSGYLTKMLVSQCFPFIDKKFVSSNLTVPPETLHLVLQRLLDETPNISTLISLRAVNQILTTKLNELIDIYMPNSISITSFCSDYEELKFYVRENYGSEQATLFFNVVTKMIKTNVSDAYSWYVDNHSDSENVPVLDTRITFYIDRYSEFLGLTGLKYDSFSMVDLRQSENTLLAEALSLISREPKLNSDVKEFYILTNDNQAYKLIFTGDDLFIKRFVSNL